MSFPVVKYVDRGWWLSFDIDKTRHLRKREFPRVMTLLSQGECYELIHDDGSSVIRGIYMYQASLLKPMVELFLITSEWSGVEIHLRGNRLDSTQKHLVGKMFACARRDAPCTVQNPETRFLFLGCHLKDSRIGLSGFFPSCFDTGPYWFSFFEQDEKNRDLFLLNEFKLKNAITELSMCPLFPPRSWQMIRLLPKQINFNCLADIEMWVPTNSVSWANNKKHISSVIPRSPKRYNKWLMTLLEASFPENGEGSAYINRY
ncbi:MAG: hypothetical protein JW925_14325 [Syntrophaceae bacterium]|nr:hypothetical protein [Syntrophaceae bacterium]